MEQQSPFNFTKPIPPKIKLSGGINLSFYVNHAVVFQYRYRLEVPQGGITGVNRSLLNWTSWINNDINEISIPKLEKEGRYRFVVEYKTHTNNEIIRFEKMFDVYDPKPLTASSTAQIKNVPSPVKTVPELSEPIAETRPPKQLSNQNINTINQGNIEQLNNKKIIEEKKIERETNKKRAEDISVAPAIAESKNSTNYDLLLREAFEKKDPAILKVSLENGAGTNIKGLYGGNMFHLLEDLTASEDVISVLKSKGLSINEPDNYRNTPLHYAIIKGESIYARYLINNGANLNLKNQVDLSPLHLAVLLNNKSVANDLIGKGANIDIAGNTGYTPLHIASEMNKVEIASDLLRNGANATIKTDQRLSSKQIAKIQKNTAISSLIRCDGSCSPTHSISGTNLRKENTLATIPKIEFDLAYDQLYVKNRQTAKVIQMIAAPVFALCAAGSVYFKLEANNYYSLYQDYKTQEGSMDLAKYNYDKTKEYDTYFYISGGVSIVSLYAFFHSTIWKRNITNKMRKIF
jgi:ankyrin repeat protein